MLIFNWIGAIIVVVSLTIGGVFSYLFNLSAAYISVISGFISIDLDLVKINI